jgi:hypothetical protein
MADSFMEKRAILPRGQQRKIIDKAIEKLSVEKIATIFNVSERTVRDLRRERFSINAGILDKICKKIGIPFPRQAKLRDRYWYTAKGSSAGGTAVLKKYGRIGGDPEYRKKKWREWWERKGKHKCIITSPKFFKKPTPSKDFAEFVGIILGDGGVTRNQMTITLHRRDDKDYSKFVISLIKKLFDVPVGIYYKKDNSTIDLIISRSGLIRFCQENFDMKIGNKTKQQVDIPRWIKENNSYLTCCIRGLMDTDGCLFAHRYKVRGKWYSYKKLSFTNHSKPIIKSVFDGFKMLGFSPRVTAEGVDVRIERKNDVRKYFAIVKPHNSKYLKRYVK